MAMATTTDHIITAIIRTTIDHTSTDPTTTAILTIATTIDETDY